MTREELNAQLKNLQQKVDELKAINAAKRADAERARAELFAGLAVPPLDGHYRNCGNGGHP